MPKRRHLAMLLCLLSIAFVAPFAAADDPPPFDEHKLVGHYAADQSPPDDPNLTLLAMLELRADHTATFRKYAKAPEHVVDNSALGTWKFSGDTLTITVKSEAASVEQTLDFTVAQDGRVLINAKPLAVILTRDFTSPKFPTAPATQPTSPASAPAPPTSAPASTGPAPTPEKNAPAAAQPR